MTCSAAAERRAPGPGGLFRSPAFLVDFYALIPSESILLFVCDIFQGWSNGFYIHDVYFDLVGNLWMNERNYRYAALVDRKNSLSLSCKSNFKS